MDHTRIPELKAKIEACRPDLLVLTGDIFDEFTEPEELDAFCKLFGELDAPLGKYYVLGNHDLFHHWREPSLAARIWSAGSPPRACAFWRTRPSCCPAVCASWAARIICTRTAAASRRRSLCPAAPTTTTRSGSTMSRGT